MTDFCPNCGKPKSAAKAGSITSHFFQYKYCQCQTEGALVAAANNKNTNNRKELNRICLNCGKSRPENQKAGSFTGYLFKELRCQCQNPKFERSGSATTKRTQSAERLGLKRGYSERFRGDAHSSQALAIKSGTIIGGTFKVISLIGKGGMGTIYLAEHLALQRQFALKVLAPDLIDEQYWQRFKAEAKTLSSLNHPNLVNVYDLGIHENSIFYYSMDYLHGRNLEEILAIEGPLGLDRSISIYLAVLDALAYAHRNGIIHRDIKPANIFVCDPHTCARGSEIKVLDFGIAKLLKSAGDSQKLTAAGEVFGSPYYMSPEQCTGGEVDARSDIYAVGCSIFETLTGYVPYEADSSIAIAIMHEEEEVPHLADFTDRELPQSIDRVIRKSLAKLPRERYQSAKVLALDLESVQEGKEVLEEIESDFPKAGNNLSGILTGSIAVAAAISLCAVGYWAWPHFNQPAQKKVIASAAVQKARSELDQTSSLSLPGADFEADAMLKTKPHDYLTGVKLVEGKKFKVFSFPTNFTLGDLSFIDEKGLWSSKPAQGECVIPFTLRPTLQASDIVAERPDLLDMFHPDDLGGLRIDNVDIKILKAHLKRLTELRELQLISMNISDDDMAVFDNLKNIDIFILRNGKKLTGERLSHSKLLSRVSHIEITTTCDNINPALRVLAGNHRLINLVLGNIGLSKEDFATIASIALLKTLQINDSIVTPADLRQLSSLNELETLKIERSPEADLSWLSELKKFKNLKQLQLPLRQRNPLIGRIQAELPKLVLSCTGRITDKNHLER